MELFSNGDYAKANDTTKPTYLIKDFWIKAAALMGRDSWDAVKKAFARGPQKWVAEYNGIRGEGNTGGKPPSFKDITNCAENKESLAKSVVLQYAMELGMSTKAGPTFTDEGEYKTVREVKKKHSETTEDFFLL